MLSLFLALLYALSNYTIMQCKMPQKKQRTRKQRGKNKKQVAKCLAQIWQKQQKFKKKKKR